MYRRNLSLLAVAAGLVAGGAGVGQLERVQPAGSEARAQQNATQPGERVPSRSLADRVVSAIVGRAGNPVGSPASSPNGGKRPGLTRGRRHASLKSRSRRRRSAARAKRARRA